MKTVCPHCNQKYDIPEDYLQLEVSCEKCQQNFLATKAKFCSECGKANPSQASHCHHCQKPLSSEIECDDSPVSNSKPSPDMNGTNQAGAKLSIIMQIVVSIYALGYFVCFSAGVIMTFGAFFNNELLMIGRFFYLVYGISVSIIFGKLLYILSILSRPNKKAVQTRYSQFALYAGIVISLIGVVASFFSDFSGGRLILNVILCLLNILFLYKILQLWRTRCIMDESYNQSQNVESPHGPLLGRISGAVGTVSLFFPPLGIVAIILGIIALRKKQKKGWYGIILGCISTVGALILLYYCLSLK